MLVKQLILLSNFLLCISANPQRYPHVPTSQFDEDLHRLSDLGMHPHEAQESKRISAKSTANIAELTKEFWMENAMNFVEKQAAKTANTKKAKNVIFFLGDGMGHTSIAAARVAMGGEEKKLSFENFPHVASAKTFCVNAQVPDSACTITSLLHGVNTNAGVIGLNAATTRANCADHVTASKSTKSIAELFLESDRSAGVVTTTRITHATPAGVYAHTANRDWEGNANVASSGCNHQQLDEIAEQLVHGAVGSKLKVILGGGSSFFVNASTLDHGMNGRRTDGKNLIQEWLATDSGRRSFVRNRDELMAAKIDEVDQLFGLFNSDHLPYQLEVEERKQQSIYPTLTDMTMKAIDVLSKDDEGYFLLVESGRIDHAHHAAQARLAVGETIEFQNAIQATVDRVNLDETLIVVTADHSHTMTISGYAARGGDIFGTTGTAEDGMPYYVLSYANGPGYSAHRVQGSNSRVNPSLLDSSSLYFRYPGTVPLVDETHAGEDVGLWAIGPNSHIFKGVLEQSVVAHAMAYASCVGDGLKACD